MKNHPASIFLALLFLFGCAPSNTSTSTPAHTSVPVNTPAPTEQSATLDLTNPPVVTNWQRYIHAATGVSLDYPAGWEVEVESDPGGYLIMFKPQKDISNFGVNLNISWISSEDAKKRIAKPPAVPGEGGYALEWNKAITTPLPGWESIVGPYPEGVDTPSPDDYAGQYLGVAYFDQSREYVIEFIVVDFDYQSLMLAKQNGFESVVAERFAYFEHMARSVTIEPLPANATPFLPTATPASTKTPAHVDQSNCLINAEQAPYISEMIRPSAQSGLCSLTMGDTYLLNYSLLYSDDWVTTMLADFVGERGQILWLRPISVPDAKILVWAQFTDLPLKNADAAIESDDVLQEKSTQTIGDKLVLVTVSTNGDQTIKRYFIRYDSHDKQPRARLFVFEVTIPTAQFDQPESQKLLQDVEAMIVSFMYLGAEPSPNP
jgi:hypothetical protein